MPNQEAESDCFVLKIAYDGASRAGKTTTVRALAELLGVETQTPQETQGRTLYFDWMEYYGGRYEGRTLRCQIVTVPGQEILRKRRERLLRNADVVVFVVDSSPSGCAEAAAPLEELQPRLAAKSPAASLLIQANKRDQEDALALDELRERLKLDPQIPTTTTVASRSEGVRETFVFAVRLALERLAAHPDFNNPATMNQYAEAPADLLAELQNLDLTPNLPATSPVAAQSSEPISVEGPRQPEIMIPDTMLPLGHMWPPVEGRKLLLQAEQQHATLAPASGEAWLATAPGWRYRSEKTAVFRDRQAGLRQMLDWAFWHLQQGSLLSQGRLLALAPDGRESAWRLWQVVRVETALDVALQEAVSNKKPATVRGLLQAASKWAKKAAESPATQELLSGAELRSLTVARNTASFADFAPTLGASGQRPNPALLASSLDRQIDRFVLEHQ